PPAPATLEWPAELLAWRATERSELVAELDRLERALGASPEVALRDLAHALAERLSGAQAGDYGERSGFALAAVATSPADLLSKLRKAREAIEAGAWSIQDPSGVEFLERPRWECGKVAFLFPGQGSQYPGMLADLAIAVPGVFQAFEEV